MRRLIPLLIALTPAVTFATVIRFDPPNPTAAMPVTVHITGSSDGQCPTWGSVRRMKDDTITVELFGEECHGQQSDPWFHAAADIPPLAAGIHKVSIVRASANGEVEVGSAQLTVRDAAPPFQVIPDVVTGHAGVSESITLSGPGINTYGCRGTCPKVLIHIGDSVVDVSNQMNTFDSIVLTAPPHAPGTVDVSIERDGVIMFRSTAALHFSGYGTGDRAFFENVLVPVLLTGPGAFGSQWKSELTIYNGNDYPIAGSLVTMCDPPPCAGPQARSLFDPLTGNVPEGFAFPLPRQAAPKVSFGLLVRDLTKQAEALGTELPIIREADLRDGEFSLLNVPTDSRFRVGLRLYGIDDVRSVWVRFRPMNNGGSDLGSDLLALSPTPPNTGRPPTFLFIQDLLSKYPQLAGHGMIRVDIDAAGARVWGFASVTNNETQHVTVISPQ